MCAQKKRASLPGDTVFQTAQHRSVDWLTDHPPGGSRAYKIQFVRDTLELLKKDGLAFKVFMHMGPDGHSMEKPVVLWRSCEWGPSLKWLVQRPLPLDATC